MARILVEGKEITIPKKVEDITREDVVSAIQEMVPEVYKELKNRSWEMKVIRERDLVIIVRESAIFG